MSGNKAKKDKDSILVDIKNILKVYDPAFMRFPKIRRLHGPALEFERACYDLLRNFHSAKAMSNRKDELELKIKYMTAMMGAYGVMLATFDLLMDLKADTQKSSDPDAVGKMYLLSDSVKLEIARNLESLEEGMVKWRSSLKMSRIMSDEWSAENARSSSAEFRG